MQIINASERERNRAAATEIVREGRARLGLTQQQMGKLVARSQGEISRIESGKVEPPIWIIMYLLHIYPDLLSSPNAGVQQLKVIVRALVEKMDEPTLRAVLAVSKR
jgi:predicted transcriptional regulator